MFKEAIKDRLFQFDFQKTNFKSLTDQVYEVILVIEASKAILDYIEAFKAIMDYIKVNKVVRGYIKVSQAGDNWD